MIVNCPVCEKEEDVTPGKYICSNCNSKFEYIKGEPVILIKRKKVDFWTLLMSIIFPILFIVLFVNETARRNFYTDNELFAGVFMILYPFLILIRQLFHIGSDSYLFLNLYSSFFSKQLHKEDIGRKLAFYLTLLTHLIGLILILKYIFT